ncbi:DEKNAAC105499 [Brettanomyces naardenensis]|uniref:DEKNAAC105499 n=1 Tax=Brettanomyces naardenensis TaxID=13370 RepID=A0A448YU64_BRENA|nr:DEKNAAC105499 [Brettanomyces naardenensis]
MQFTSLLALAGAALAATTSSLNATLTSTTSVAVASGCSFSKTLTVTAQAQLDALASCEAIKGDIYITGDLGTGSIANVKAIYGDLSIFNATLLASFAADSIGAISGELSLESLTILSQLSFGSLTSVGAINWVTLPALVDTGLNQVTDCNSIYISDTQLSSLEGLNPTNVETYNINNNLNLASIDSEIETVSNALSISHNGDNTEVAFDGLQWANNLTFYSVSSISMPNLQAINQSAGVFESSVESLKFPLVQSVGADLTIENNKDLTDLEFANLTSVGGGFVVVNNTDLKSIGSLSNLKSVTGAVDVEGDFDNFTLPALKTVRGAFTVVSTGDFDCSDFEKLSKQGSIQGDFECKAGSSSSSSSSTKTSSSSSTGSSSSSSSSSSSKGAAAELEIRPVSILGTFVALMFALF